MITTSRLRSRTVRLIAVLSAIIVTVAVLAVAALDAPSALARVAPDGLYPATIPPQAIPVVTSTPVTDGQSGSGLAVWLVVVIGIAALAAGAALAELARFALKNRTIGRPSALPS